MVHKFVVGDVPIATGLLQRSLKDHLTLSGPDLKKEGAAVVVLEDALVFDFEEDGAEVGLLVVVAAGHDLVELVKGHGVHHVPHKVFR